MCSTERVFSEEVTYQIYDILSDPDARKPMFGDRVPMNLPFKVALKTGTTKAYTDLWAIGTTKEYTVGVWGGNFDGSPTHRVMSVQGATPLMRAIYTAIAGACPGGYDCVEQVCVEEGTPAADATVSAPDASVPDAVPAATCDEMFGAAPGYELCSEDEASCSFNVALDGTACTMACELLGTTCLGAFDNNAILCEPVPETGDTCDTVRSTNICVCARIPAE